MLHGQAQLRWVTPTSETHVSSDLEPPPASHAVSAARPPRSAGPALESGARALVVPPRRAGTQAAGALRPPYQVGALAAAGIVTRPGQAGAAATAVVPPLRRAGGPATGALASPRRAWAGPSRVLKPPRRVGGPSTAGSCTLSAATAMPMGGAAACAFTPTAPRPMVGAARSVPAAPRTPAGRKGSSSVLRRVSRGYYGSSPRWRARDGSFGAGDTGGAGGTAWSTIVAFGGTPTFLVQGSWLGTSLRRRSYSSSALLRATGSDAQRTSRGEVPDAVGGPCAAQGSKGHPKGD